MMKWTRPKYQLVKDVRDEISHKIPIVRERKRDWEIEKLRVRVKMKERSRKVQ